MRHESLVVPDRSLPYLNLCLAFDFGSAWDPEGKEGLAWLTAQMLERGSRGLSRHQLAEALEGLGSELELSVGRRSTLLWADGLSRHQEQLLSLLELVFLEPTFPQDELDKLKRELLADLDALRDDDAALGYRHFLAKLFDGHPYGRPVRGWEPSLREISRGDIEAFYRYYHQERGFWALTGDVDEALLGALERRILKRLPPSGPIPHLPVFTEAGRSEGWHVLLVDKPERTQAQVYLGHRVFEGKQRRGALHPDWTALQIGQTAFGGMFSSRFTYEIREKRGWSYGASSQLTGDAQVGTFLCHYYPATRDLMASLSLTAELLEAFVEEGPSVEEVQRAQLFLKNNAVFSVDTASRRLSAEIRRRLVGQPPGWVEGVTERIAAVNPAQAQQAVRQHLRADGLVAVIVATAKDVEKDLRRWPRLKELEVVSWLE